MNITQNLSERLRLLVGFNGWDYCVFWKLSEDQRLTHQLNSHFLIILPLIFCSFIFLLLLCSSAVSPFWSYKRNSIEAEHRRRKRNSIEAEHRRRTKLYNNLCILRSLVPTISKLDRASILGDAIQFVKHLQKQVKELQDELEKHSDMGVQQQQQPDNVVGVEGGSKGEQMKTQNGFPVGTSGNGYPLKQKQELDAPCDKQTQQMEPQVEVEVKEGNELFVKVFYKHRPGRFVKLMEAFNTLHMEVIHTTVTRHTSIVFNVFKVERKENQMVEAEDLRESLLELMRNPCRGWNL